MREELTIIGRIINFPIKKLFNYVMYSVSLVILSSVGIIAFTYDLEKQKDVNKRWEVNGIRLTLV